MMYHCRVVRRRNQKVAPGQKWRPIWFAHSRSRSPEGHSSESVLLKATSGWKEYPQSQRTQAHIRLRPVSASFLCRNNPLTNGEITLAIVTRVCTPLHREGNKIWLTGICCK